jgi:solute carrier family 26, other
VVVVALKGMLLQIFDFARFKKRSNLDAFVWMVTFLSVVTFSIDIGLLIGIILSIMCIFYSGLKSHFTILGHLPNSDLYLDIESFQRAIEMPFVKIVRYTGSINYATKASFKNRLCDKLNINLVRELQYQENHQQNDMNIIKKKNCSSLLSNLNFKELVLDFSTLTNIDASSTDMLTELIKDFNKLNVNVRLVCFSTRIIEILMRNEFVFMKNIYPTIHDAIGYVEST